MMSAHHGILPPLATARPLLLLLFIVIINHNSGTWYPWVALLRRFRSDVQLRATINHIAKQNRHRKRPSLDCHNACRPPFSLPDCSRMWLAAASSNTDLRLEFSLVCPGEALCTFRSLALSLMAARSVSSASCVLVFTSPANFSAASARYAVEYSTICETKTSSAIELASAYHWSTNDRVRYSSMLTTHWIGMPALAAVFTSSQH
jgi:hypothetical protein